MSPVPHNSPGIGGMRNVPLFPHSLSRLSPRTKHLQTIYGCQKYPSSRCRDGDADWRHPTDCRDRQHQALRSYYEPASEKVSVFPHRSCMVDRDRAPERRIEPMSVAHEVADGDAIGTTELARTNHLQPSTVLRWILRGLPDATGSRVRLEAVKRGKRWVTSRAALKRFFAALPQNIDSSASPRSPLTPSTRTADRRQREQEAARTALAERGI